VDYQRRSALLADVDARLERDGRTAVAPALLSDVADDRLKLFTTAVLLRFRRTEPELFDRGGYAPLAVEGVRHLHAFAFSRACAGRDVVVVVPRLMATLLPDHSVPPLGERVWGDTRIVMPPSPAARYQHVLTDRCVPLERQGDRVTVRAADLFEHFPVAVLDGRTA
jgi:(1->4)-alpha-D-glucan 1-alpha-D-glucosylmutase